ncbi:peptidase C25 [Flavobacterium rivuli WB 3.3-2 = DSM 21788]|uniref:Peptidase C25 n=1 Tax=Flavobacterium rivuli WB 3.3-2 = DSM 21788 TaxID=1121895 RepID=A0A0A2M504_9FLAO|nr:type IX secretion system sortase PorU [Flavobacterium rivuli]KGO87364.1 peptidase C25 [Flavobacterium rivuli WB 3.3-2 = DSM 21788]
MKNRLLLFVLLFSLLSYGQQGGQIVLNWVDNVPLHIVDKPISLPQFENEYMNFDPVAKQLSFYYTFETPGIVNPASLRVTNVVYEGITQSQLGGLTISNIPASINAVLEASQGRDQWYAGLKLSPIVKEGSGFKRVKSFSYSYALGGSASRSTAAVTAITSSVLATGEWSRFYVEKSGIYKLSKSFLQQIGVDVNADPRTIKIYGNGGRMAPLLNATYYPDDLAENAIKFLGEEDGRFDSGDYILFYAEGVDNWNTDSDTNNNLFADRSYYYVTSKGTNGKRIQEMAQPSGNAVTQTSVFDEYQYHEQDLINIARLGRKWHGEAFNVDSEQKFEFDVPDIANEPVTVTVGAAASSVSASSMVVTANDAPVSTLNFRSLPDNVSATEDIKSGTISAPANGKITVKLTYNNAGVPSANAWLDYVIIQAKRNLDGNGRQFRFRYNTAANNIGTIQYNFTNAAGIEEVWDITDIYNAAKITNTAGAQFSFKASQGEVRQYISVVSSDYYAPLKESNTRMANQNLKGTIFRNSTGQFQDIDYIIVTPASLNASAEILANHHRTTSGLNVKVVNLENIYQEFSSGKQDIAAIRNFIKYVYNNASDDSKKVKYVNLFGDASFDYKNRIRNNSNIVPTFHGFAHSASDNNYSVVNTFVTDDFFGLMDPNEGQLLLSGDGNVIVAERVDVATGRMLVNNRVQADQMVNKVLEYESTEAYGRWRCEYIATVDDLDGAGSTGFVNNMEQVVNNLKSARPYVNVRKIYEDAYVQQSSAGGQRYPEATEQLIRSINYGALAVIYLGHGGESGLASEQLFKTSDAQNLTNRYKYPLFITATCELTKFDNPFVETAGEHIYWNPAGGGIAMITTTRALFISDANVFNPRITERLYAYGLPEYPTMAEAMRLTKNTMNPTVRMICFIGDPALKMAIPKPNIVLTTINDVPIAQSTDVLQALGRVKLGGNVTDANGTMLTNFNGELEVTVFDKDIARATLNNDNMTELSDPSNPRSPLIPIIRRFNTLGETIFRGNASVTNGRFEFSFVVPRDIRIPVAEGRVSFYSKKNNALEDHIGYNSVIKIGGVNTSAAEDNLAPTVKLYMNTETFISGGITNASPILLAYLEDANGINTASGIGHDIMGILDGDDTNQFLMNDYYESDVNDYSHGTVRFPFANLSKGLHTLTFRAWDVYNNLVTAEIQFVVAGDDELTLEKVLNYPNPFVSYTEFWFSHNRPFEPLDVQVQVFTVTGKIVKTINQTVTTDGFLSRELKWDGRDDFGDKIGKGVYIYKLTVRSVTSNKKAEKYEKLVLL